jgi:TRAP transporter TAXI family solute receptor
MKVSIRKSLMAAALAASALTTHIASAETYNMSVAGASPGGLWSLLGAGIDAAVKAEHPGSTITYQTSGGGIANVALLQRGDASLGLIEDAVLQLARDGEAPFRESAKDLRVLANLYTWAPMQAIMRKEFAEKHGISNLSDLARVKPPITIAINKRGNVASSVALEMLEAVGAGPEKIKSWGGKVIYAASGEQTELIQDRRVDMLLNSLFVRHSSIMRAAGSVEMVLLPMPKEAAQKVAKKTGTERFVIPAGTYDWAAKDVPTVSISAALAVRADMKEETAYNLTKALFENYKQIADVHPAMKQLTPQIMASVQVVPYHEGALRYLKEAGLR